MKERAELVAPGYMRRRTLTGTYRTLVRQYEKFVHRPGWQGAVRLPQSSCRKAKTSDKPFESFE